MTDDRVRKTLKQSLFRAKHKLLTKVSMFTCYFMTTNFIKHNKNRNVGFKRST